MVFLNYLQKNNQMPGDAGWDKDTGRWSGWAGTPAEAEGSESVD
jgi:hypothetical protein